MRVLGGLEVEGVEQRALGGRKARVVLKVLALGRGRPVSTDRLADAVWGDEPPSRPSDDLAVLVSRLRSVIGRDRIRSTDAGYHLALDWLDVDAMVGLVDTSAEAALRGDLVAAHEGATAALALARAPLLPEDVDAPWTMADRAAAQRAVARARHLAADTALALDRAEEAVDVASAALADDGYDEEALRQLMRALRRRGRTAAGLAAYAQVRRRLVDELGADLSPETEAVHLSLLRSDVPTVPARRCDAEPIVGRDTELGLLVEELAAAARGPSRLVVVEGEPGIGKSALLSAFAEHAETSGAVVLHGASEPVFAALPLQSVIDALGAHLRACEPANAIELLGADLAVLGPLVGLRGAPGPTAGPWPEMVGQTYLFAAFARVFARLAAERPVALVVDDVHLAGASTADLLHHVVRRVTGLVVVASRRTGEGWPLAAGRTIELGPLDQDAAALLVGVERAASLQARARGNPLFLTQLAAVGPESALPASIVEAVGTQVASLGDRGATVRTAAVLGSSVDVELLAAVQRRDPLELLTDLEHARARGLLVDDGAGLAFRHALVREALAEATPPARAALVHREAARVLARRPGSDPLAVAHHARLGGDVDLAGDALVAAADLANQRFDRDAAAGLLDQAVLLADAPVRRLARARTRTMQAAYDDALDDVEVALQAGGGAAALETGAWAAYFARRFALAGTFADDGAALATDAAVRASCLAVAGRVRHAGGDLAGAEARLVEAAATAMGEGRVVPNVWLGVLRSHQSRPAEALELLRPITRVSGAERTTELLHALLFSGHASALGGRPGEALDLFERYELEVRRRHAPRFAGRGWNFTGWVRRALGDWRGADEANLRAVDELGAVDFAETRIASALDLADGALLRGDLDGAATALARASEVIDGPLTFGWRLGLRLRLDEARVDLASGRTEAAVDGARTVAAEAEALGVPRYALPARLLVARSLSIAGRPVDLTAVAPHVEALDAAVGIDAWWLTAEAGRDLDVAAWRDLAGRRANALTDRRPDEGLVGALESVLGRARGGALRRGL